MGELIAILTTLSWSIGIFPFTEAAKRLGAAALNQYRLLLAHIIISLILLIAYQFSIPYLFAHPTKLNFLYLGLSGIIGFTLGDYFSFKSFTQLGPKLASLYTTIAPGAALVAGFFILDQRLNLIGLVGIAISIAGVIWLTINKKDIAAAEKSGFARNKTGILFGVLGACCQGFGLVLSKLGLEELINGEKIEILHGVWIRLLAAWLAAFVISIFTGRFISNSKPIFTNQNSGLKYMVAGTLFGPVIGVSLSLITITKMPVAVAQTIFALLPIFVIPLNYFFYKEKITLASIIASIIAVLGVFVLIWREEITTFLGISY